MTAEEMFAALLDRVANSAREAELRGSLEAVSSWHASAKMQLEQVRAENDRLREDMLRMLREKVAQATAGGEPK